MAFAWPLGLLGLFMLLVVRISGEIGEHSGLRSEAQWAAALIGALAFPALDKFSPGSFDHHNVEMVLGLTAVWGIIRMREQPLWGIGAGAALGLAMATAAEGVPMVAVALVVAGLLWLFRPTEFARGFARLGLGLAASSLVMLAVLVPPSEWGKPVCDAMGLPSSALVLSAVVLLSRLPSCRQRWARRCFGALVHPPYWAALALSSWRVSSPNASAGAMPRWVKKCRRSG